MPLSYKLVLTLHIIAVISWMAGLLYLFRLFVYHAAETEKVVKERFCVMEGKLYRIITQPAMIVAFIAGIAMLAMNPPLLRQPWMHAKILLVVIMAGITGYGGALVTLFKVNQVNKTHRYFRVMNEVPTLLMILIVFLVIVKPWA